MTATSGGRAWFGESATAYSQGLADGAAAERDLLTQAEDALHSVAMQLLVVSPQLKTPYTDMPEQSAWSRTIGPQARRAHDLAQAIRKHLGLPFRHMTRALGTPPLEVEDVISQAVTAERESIRQLATERDAAYRTTCELPDCPYNPQRHATHLHPFADLIGETP